MQDFTGLPHKALEGLGRRGAVLADVLVSETSPGVVVSGFYGSYPGEADEEASFRMEVTDKHLNA